MVIWRADLPLVTSKNVDPSKFLSRFQDFEPLQLGRSFQLSYVDTSYRQDENLPGEYIDEPTRCEDWRLVFLWTYPINSIVYICMDIIYMFYQLLVYMAYLHIYPLPHSKHRYFFVFVC